MKERYIDLMEKAVSIYTVPMIEDYIRSVRENGLSEHGFPRMAANIGILLAHGRAAHLRELFVEIMDLCCAEMPVALRKYDNPTVGNEFSVREITMCLMELERSGAFPAAQLAQWKAAIASMDPYAVYSNIAPVPAKPMGNWAAFAATSEQARICAGIASTHTFVDHQIASQMFAFDENGMYRDPHEPMVYDLVGRLQLAFALHLGYTGTHSQALAACLLRGSEHTAFMQSVTGELPFGGRSNQVIGTEGHLAALLEYEAGVYKARGDLKAAGMRKRAATLAADAIEHYLNVDHMYHMKNRYPYDSGFGCEGYAYFNKYMITTASFLYMAHALADDSIQPLPCPAETGGYIHETSAHFHKTFVNFGGYFLEYDTNADFHYDCNGLGRVHRRGAPSMLCLSVPVPPTPAAYQVDMKNPGPLSLCGGVLRDGVPVWACEQGTRYEPVMQRVTPECAQLVWKVTLRSGDVLTESCTVTQQGVTLRYAGDGELAALLPAFEWDGYEHAAIACGESSASIRYDGWVCRYSSALPIALTGDVYANRNGHYRSMIVRGRDAVEVQIALEKAP